jgi:anti-sigma-K factor RskA
MTLPCEEIDDLLPAYAVDALEREDHVQLLEHLAECREHDAELLAYRAVVGRLPAIIEERAAPARLRNDMLRAFDSAGRDASPPTAPRRWRMSPRQRLRPAFAYGLVAVLFLVVTSLAAWNIFLQSTDGEESVIFGTAERDGMRLRGVYFPGQQLALLEVDMPPPPPDRVYQAWQLTSRGPVSLGLLQHNKGAVAFWGVNLSGATAVALSAEPAGGSVAPTTPPLIVSQLF